jgi:hypothetical protein
VWLDMQAAQLELDMIADGVIQRPSGTKLG